MSLPAGFAGSVSASGGITDTTAAVKYSGASADAFVTVLAPVNTGDIAVSLIVVGLLASAAVFAYAVLIRRKTAEKAE